MTTTTVRSTTPPPVVVSRSWLPDVLRQSATLAGRGVTKTVHSTEALLDVTLQPVIFLLLFVYVFGGAIAGDTGTYLQYALPGVLVQTVVFASAGTGTGLADDLKTGIFDRFRSLPISRTAPLLARSERTSSGTSRPERSCWRSGSCSGSARAAASSGYWARSGW
jgi:oleandomycin transport system permease protein